MDVVLNDYHKKMNAIKIAKVAYWRAHPLLREVALRRLRNLRDQRLANLSK